VLVRRVRAGEDAARDRGVTEPGDRPHPGDGRDAEVRRADMPKPPIKTAEPVAATVMSDIATWKRLAKTAKLTNE
jgi:hypothetical protein